MKETFDKGTALEAAVLLRGLQKHAEKPVSARIDAVCRKLGEVAPVVPVKALAKKTSSWSRK